MSSKKSLYTNGCKEKVKDIQLEYHEQIEKLEPMQDAAADKLAQLKDPVTMLGKNSKKNLNPKSKRT